MVQCSVGHRGGRGRGSGVVVGERRSGIWQMVSETGSGHRAGGADLVAGCIRQGRSRGSICVYRTTRARDRRCSDTSAILPQILGSLPEVIRSCCHHHHHHTPPKVFAERCTNARSRGALAFTSQPPEPSGGRPWEAAFGQRHPSRPASRRSIGRPRHLEPDR